MNWVKRIKTKAIVFTDLKQTTVPFYVFTTLVSFLSKWAKNIQWWKRDWALLPAPERKWNILPVSSKIHLVSSVGSTTMMLLQMQPRSAELWIFCLLRQKSPFVCARRQIQRRTAVCSGQQTALLELGLRTLKTSANVVHSSHLVLPEVGGPTTRTSYRSKCEIYGRRSTAPGPLSSAFDDICIRTDADLGDIPNKAPW